MDEIVFKINVKKFWEKRASAGIVREREICIRLFHALLSDIVCLADLLPLPLPPPLSPPLIPRDFLFNGFVVGLSLKRLRKARSNGGVSLQEINLKTAQFRPSLFISFYSVKKDIFFFQNTIRYVRLKEKRS